MPPVTDSVGTTKPVDTTAKTLVRLIFENYVGDKPLQLDDAAYDGNGRDKYVVNTYNYYISNIRLITVDGNEYAEPESYHLIRQNQPVSKQVTIRNVPKGNYTQIKFLIGVDSARNNSGAQTGALAPENGMFWTWSTGYIMAMFEAACSSSPNGRLSYHITGYKGANSVLRWVTLPLPVSAAVDSNKAPVITIKSDVAEWFKAPATIDFATTYLINSAGSDAARMADNYADMFSVTKVD